MFTSIIRTIIGIKFHINSLTVTLFSGPGPKSPLSPVPGKSQNAVGDRVKIPADIQAYCMKLGIRLYIYSCYKASSISSPHLIVISGT